MSDCRSVPESTVPEPDVERMHLITADDIPMLQIPEECWDEIMQYFTIGLSGSLDSKVFQKALNLGLFVKKPAYIDNICHCTEIPPASSIRKQAWT